VCGDYAGAVDARPGHRRTLAANVARALADADADDKSEIFRRLGLKLTYHPGRRLVEESRLMNMGFPKLSED